MVSRIVTRIVCARYLLLYVVGVRCNGDISCKRSQQGAKHGLRLLRMDEQERQKGGKVTHLKIEVFGDDDRTAVCMLGRLWHDLNAADKLNPAGYSIGSVNGSGRGFVRPTIGYDK